MKLSKTIHWLATVALVLTIVAAYMARAETAGNSRPALLEAAATFTKRSVTASAVTDLCTLTGGRECVIVNRTDQTLCLKSPANDATCAATTIDCNADTDLVIVPSGQSWSQVRHDIARMQGAPDTSQSTLCGKMALAPAGDCATPTSIDCVYSVEAL